MSDIQLPTVSRSDALSRIDPNHLLDVYLQRYDRPNTRRSYRSDLVDFFGTDAVDLDMARSISFVQVNQYIAALEADGRKTATIRRRIASVRGFFDWLHALGATELNPAQRQLIRRVKTVSSRDRPIVFLTATQASALLDAAELAGEAAVRNRVMMLTMLHCVLRRSEVAAMDAEHVRPLGRYWVLDLPDTKGGSDQFVKIPAHVVDEIDAHKAFYNIDSGPLWRSVSRRNAGQRLTPTSVYRIVRQAAERAGLPEIGAHTLRHTGCTLAIEAGASLQQVQSHARHKQIETTMVYIHQRDRLRDSAADYIHMAGPKSASAGHAKADFPDGNDQATAGGSFSGTENLTDTPENQ